MNEHKDRVHSSILYPCDKCVKSFTCKSYLKKHETAHCISEKTFKCEYCDKDFLTWSHLKRHVKTPRDNKKKSQDIVCKYCDKSFTKNELNSHLKEHIIETFNCDVCSKSVIRAAINHVLSLLFTLPPTNVRQSQMTPIMTPRVTVRGGCPSHSLIYS